MSETSEQHAEDLLASTEMLGKRLAEISSLKAELHSFQLQRIEQEAFTKEYIERTDKALFCSEDLTCGTCRGCMFNDISRLKRGDFTNEEFQNLCHNRHEKEGCTAKDFFDGCAAYQKNLFGKSERDRLRQAVKIIQRYTEMCGSNDVGMKLDSDAEDFLFDNPLEETKTPPE